MPHQKPATPDLCYTAPPFVVNHKFNDVDELAEVTNSWALDFRQLNRGVFKGSDRQAVIGPIHLTGNRMNPSFQRHSVSPITSHS